MIFYFTGTGNSLYVAKQIEEHPISIPQVIHQDELNFTDESIGIVCPIYGHTMPEMVKEFIIKATFDTEYFYLVLTYGKRHGGAVELADDFLKSIGKKADYINHIVMVDNFLPGFDMDEQIATESEKEIDKHIELIKKDIQKKKSFRALVTQTDRDAHQEYLSRTPNGRPDDFFVKVYTVTDECIGCGICSRVCPAGCIKIEKQRAIHTGENCQMCMACIHHCPKKAITMSMPEKNPNARFHNSHIKLTEIVAANDQTSKK